VRLQSGSADDRSRGAGSRICSRRGSSATGRPVDYRSEAVAKRDWQPEAVRIESNGDGVQIISRRSRRQHLALEPTPYFVHRLHRRSRQIAAG